MNTNNKLLNPHYTKLQQYNNQKLVYVVTMTKELFWMTELKQKQLVIVNIKKNTD